MIVILICLMSVFARVVFPQTWNQIAPTISPSGAYNFSHSSFLDKDNGWIAVLDAGLILRTRDGGQSFDALTEISSAWLRGIQFVDNANGWLLAENPSTREMSILKSANGGASWTSTGATHPITNFIFLDSLQGIMSGGSSIYYSSNGGQSWSESLVGSPLKSTVLDFHFRNSTEGWAVGANNVQSHTGVILKTSNAGISWTYQDSAVGGELYAVSFMDSLIGGAIGAVWQGSIGAIFMTYDGGITWEDIPLITIPRLNDIVLLADGTGWVVGDNGLLMFTINRGLNWEIVDLGIDDNLEEIYFLADGQYGFITGQGDNTIYYFDRYLGLGEITQPSIPIYFILHNNYPNPFNASTVISYDLLLPAHSRLTIYNLQGRPVQRFNNTVELIGHYSFKWDAVSANQAQLPSGVYIYKVEANGYTKTNKMVLLK